MALLPHSHRVQDVTAVARALQELAALLKLQGEPTFKVKAYARAAEVVIALGEELLPLIDQGRLRELPGIGRALSGQIQELWNLGTSELLLRLRATHPEGAGELAQVEGMTPRRIQTLHQLLNIHSVSALRDACAAGRVRQLPGFRGTTEQRLLASAERRLHREPATRSPMLLSRGLQLGEQLVEGLRRAGDEAYLAGALRRGEETVSQLELVVVGECESVYASVGVLPRVLRVDRTRSVAQMSDGVAVALHVTGAAALGNAMVRGTGDDAHVQALRFRASQLGFALFTERAEDAPGAQPPIRAFATEAALYHALGLSYVPPEQRFGRDVGHDGARTPLNELVTSADIQGMVHCHTTYSDGRASIAEMARAAHELGMNFITITDHSASAHYAGGLTLDRLKQQWDEIAAVQEQVPIRILRGTESDILEDGCLDYPDAILEQLDVIIASVHARYKMNRDQMTARIARAMALPFFKIWGHGLGRIINHRPPIDCDVAVVLDALAGSRGAIEINADPHRLDLPPAFIPAARQRAIPFVISVDAHSTRGFDVLRYGVTMARRGGLSRQEVLNTLGATAFADRVRPT